MTDKFIIGLSTRRGNESKEDYLDCQYPKMRQSEELKNINGKS